jgi:hypothetical protein
MVSTRSSQKTKPPSASGMSPALESSKDAEIAASSSRKPKKITSAQRKKEHAQALRLKSTGLGLSISAKSADDDQTASSINRKIVFNNQDDVNDDANSEAGLAIEDDTELAVSSHQLNSAARSDDDQDDDDDAVEEVQQTAARDQLEEQRSLERRSARAAEVKSKKRRKRKIGPTIETKDDTALQADCDFFSELDAELAGERKRKRKERVDDAKPSGTHTTFVTDGDDVRKPIQVDDNIQLVILDAMEKSNSVPISETALLYSRGRLLGGTVELSAKKKHQAKKAGRKTTENDGWKRSIKMNHLLAPGRRTLRRQGKACAAPCFVAQQSKR